MFVDIKKQKSYKMKKSCLFNYSLIKIINMKKFVSIFLLLCAFLFVMPVQSETILIEDQDSVFFIKTSDAGFCMEEEVIKIPILNNFIPLQITDYIVLEARQLNYVLIFSLETIVIDNNIEKIKVLNENNRKYLNQGMLNRQLTDFELINSIFNYNLNVASNKTLIFERCKRSLTDYELLNNNYNSNTSITCTYIVEEGGT